MKAIIFLLKRPIAVCMAIFALCILGFIGYRLLPVSLLPNIPIPEINIQVSAIGRSAKEIENLAISPIRRQLLTTDGMVDISSKSADNYGNINLRFAFNSDIDIALIDINQKVQKITENLPEDFDKPKVYKSNATDIPVEYVTMTLKSDIPYQPTNVKDFINLSEICENVVSRRLEQLQEVAMVDVNGLMKKELQVKPDPSYMAGAGITSADITNAIQANKIRPVSIRVREGAYEYSMYLENSLVSVEDVSNVTIRKNGRLYRLGDICKLSVEPQDETGQATHMGKRCVTMRIIKKHEAKVNDLKKEIAKTLKVFADKYPEIEFRESQDQTEILNYSIRSLKENFLLSLALMFVVAFLFMGNAKSPIVTAVSMTVALIISFLVFFIFNISLNILSLSGLILVVGMMIDNILITSENISQHVLSGEGIIKSCAKGTAEMITPMLSSTLTTIVVFVPLVFLSDLVGALFIDQALAISIGLMVSYFISIFLLPVLFMLFSRIDNRLDRLRHHRKLSERLTLWMYRAYDRIIDKIHTRKKTVFATAALSVPLCFLGYHLLPKAQMPKTDNREMVAKVSWNTGVPLTENAKRTNDLMKSISPMTVEMSASIGTQGYMLEGKDILSSNQTEIYVKAATPGVLDSCWLSIKEYLSLHHPGAKAEISATDNIFDRLFTSGEAPVVVKIFADDHNTESFLSDIEKIREGIRQTCNIGTEPPATQRELLLTLNRKEMETFDVSFDDISKELSSALKDIHVSSINSTSYIPVVMKNDMTDWKSYFERATVPSRDGKAAVPLSYLVRYSHVDGLAHVIADKKGVMHPVSVYPDGDAGKTADNIQANVLNKFPQTRTEIGGGIVEEAGTFSSLFGIFMISLVLMYFILCAQFESFVQPLVVLSEIPIDVCFAMFMLLLFGYSFNIMSGIGIIASCGIVVNDSILKIDAINNLIAQGMPIREAIHTAGKSRIRPIVMTSLTTIIGMVPFFFTNDIGSELQQPLALGMIAALGIGTMVSIFVVPILFEVLVLRHGNHKTPAEASSNQQ